MMHKCRLCGKPFDRRNSAAYCSRQCRGIAARLKAIDAEESKMLNGMRAVTRPPKSARQDSWILPGNDGELPSVRLFGGGGMR